MVKSNDIEDLFKITQGSKHLKMARKIVYSESEINLINELIDTLLSNNDPKFKIYNYINKLCKKHKINYRIRTFKINYYIRTKDEGKISILN